MATFVLIHGGGGTAWDWHLVGPRLRDRGHEVVAVDLPNEDPSAGWSEYVDTVVHAAGSRGDLVVVGHSLGGFTAPLVCARVPVEPTYAEELSSHYTVYTWDLPGYGESSKHPEHPVDFAVHAEAFAALVVQWNLTVPPHVVAHDFGAAWRCARTWWRRCGSHR